MPVIIRFGNVKIMMFSDDHNPPHFHVSTPDHDALIRLSDLSVLQGRITRKTLDMVQIWASEAKNRAILEREWSRLNER